jgi:nucleoside-diphosphate-sugar epimerase
MVLVSGATGLLGGHLLYRFRESAASTIALYRSKENIEHTRLIFESYGKGQGVLVDSFKWMPADLLEIPSLDAAMEGVTTVYHCAATIESSSFEAIKRDNITGTENIINVAQYWGVQHFCHVSSISALGESIGDRAVNESDFFNLDALNTDYAISKFGAEMEAWRATQEGMNVLIVNPGVILGEGKWNSGSGKLFSRTLHGNKFYTSGSSGFIDVRDATAIIMELMNKRMTNDRFILVAENLSYQEVLSNIALALIVSKPTIKLSSFFLNLISILSYITHFLRITKKLKKSTVRSLTSKTSYDNQKIVNEIGFNFTPMQETIDRIAQFMVDSKGVIK